MDVCCAAAVAYRQTAAAAERLRLSAAPHIGTFATMSAVARSAGGSPHASLPKTHAMGPVRARSSSVLLPEPSAAMTVRPAAFKASVASSRSRSSTTGRWNRLPTDAPVSYTHLRAHETVLDLVCR